MKDILNKKNRASNIALRISLIYALAGSLWILSSDTLLSLVISEPGALTHLQTFKGWAFIAVTAFLLYVLVNRYVSAMVRSDQALRESENKFRILAETAASAIFLYSDTFITVNRASEELTGYSEGELKGMSFYNLLHPDSTEKIANIVTLFPAVTADRCVASLSLSPGKARSGG